MSLFLGRCHFRLSLRPYLVVTGLWLLVCGLLHETKTHGAEGFCLPHANREMKQRAVTMWCRVGEAHDSAGTQCSEQGVVTSLAWVIFAPCIVHGCIPAALLLLQVVSLWQQLGQAAKTLQALAANRANPVELATQPQKSPRKPLPQILASCLKRATSSPNL